jgi:hypothetical protein
MPTFRIKKSKDNPYVMVHKGIVMDTRISYKAKGLLFYLLSRPDDWQVYEGELTRHSTDGLRAVRSGIKELLQAGYLKRFRLHKPNGQLAGFEYHVHEVPAKSTIMPKRNNAKQHRNTNIDLTNTDQVINLTPDELQLMDLHRDRWELFIETLKSQTGAIN